MVPASKNIEPLNKTGEGSDVCVAAPADEKMNLDGALKDDGSGPQLPKQEGIMASNNDLSGFVRGSDTEIARVSIYIPSSPPFI